MPPTNYLKFVGGIYSSEWYFAKLLKTLTADKTVQKSCYACMEHYYWISFLITGAKYVSAIKVGVGAPGQSAL